MDDHSTWFHLLPLYKNVEVWSQEYLRRESLPFGADDFLTGLIGKSHFTLAHVWIAMFTASLLLIGALIYMKKTSKDAKDRLIPEKKLGVRNLFELIMETTLGLSELVMGRKKAEATFPLIGALVFFILVNNLIGLVPGFLPATDTLKTNFGLSLLVFFVYHVMGVKAQGLAYFKHFLGPIIKWYAIPLMGMMLLIEIISHVARIFSLALRLMGNMAADHKVVAAFFVLVPLFVPLPFMLLGILVCIVQTVVFTLLTMVYIDLAVAHEEH